MEIRTKYKFLVGIVLSVVLIGLLLWGRLTPQRELAEPVTQENPIEVVATEMPTETEAPLPEKTDNCTSTPAPVQTENSITEPKEKEILTCTLSVRCDDVLKNLADLDEEKQALIPPDGILFHGETVEFSEGESVFDVLYREMQNHSIPLDFVKNPLYDSVYVKGIGNLYEYDCGSSSGWMYQVNSEKPHYGCSQYKVKPGDAIVFDYSCHF